MQIQERWLLKRIKIFLFIFLCLLHVLRFTQNGDTWAQNHLSLLISHPFSFLVHISVTNPEPWKALPFWFQTNIFHKYFVFWGKWMMGIWRRRCSARMIMTPWYLYNFTLKFLYGNLMYIKFVNLYSWVQLFACSFTKLWFKYTSWVIDFVDC